MFCQECVSRSLFDAVLPRGARVQGGQWVFCFEMGKPKIGKQDVFEIVMKKKTIQFFWGV